MKLGEYAEKSGRSVDDVRNALVATGQPTHPNRNVEESVLDSYFAGTWVKPSEPAENSEVPVSGEPEVPENDPILNKRSGRLNQKDIPKEQRVAPQGIIGTYQRGMYVFTLEPRGSKCPFPVQLHRAFGFDSSEAIANVLKYHNVTKSELVTFIVKGSEKPETLTE